MICGSMSFAKHMMAAKSELEGMGHVVDVPCDTQKFIEDPEFSTSNHEENYRHCIENDIIRKCFKSIEASDAILVLNYDKNGIEGYIGPSVLMEIGLAYHLGRKIFLINPLPDVKKSKSTHELLIMQPTILNGNLERINDS
jgi:hypothetical protein